MNVVVIRYGDFSQDLETDLVGNGLCVAGIGASNGNDAGWTVVALQSSEVVVMNDVENAAEVILEAPSGPEAPPKERPSRVADERGTRGHPFAKLSVASSECRTFAS